MVTRIRFRDARGPELELEELARQKDEMGRQPGFRAFYAIRTAPDEIILVRVYETRAELLAGLKQGRRRHLAEEFAEQPMRWIGEVVSAE
jgi:heme-degrading monooxygenase HmoA